MAIMASKPKGGGFLTPAGTHQAVCYAVWDIGLQKSEFNGSVKWLNKIVVSWEINEVIDDPDSEYHGKRFVQSQFYTLSLATKANLKRDLESWRGKEFTGAELAGFDVETLVGANCLLNIIHKETEDRTYANIAGVMPLPKGTAKMTPENPTDAPEWVQEKQRQGEQNLNDFNANNGHPQYDQRPEPPVDDSSDLPF